MKQRIKWLDVVKCFGIFLIYLGHHGEDAGNAYRFVFTHHVPLFFLLSGCAEYITDEKRLMVTVKKTFQGILLPWLFFCVTALVFFTVQHNISYGGVFSRLKTIAAGTIRNEYFAGTVWFLTCIAVVRIAFAIIKKVRFKIVIFLICFASFLCAQYLMNPHPTSKPSWIYNIDSAIYYIVYYAIGYVLFPYINKALNPQTIMGKLALFASLLISFVYAALRFWGEDPLSIFSGIPVVNKIIPIFKVLLIVWMYFVIGRLCENVEIFNQIGKATLYLCGSEYIAYQILSAFRNILGLSYHAASPLTVYIYCMVILVLLTRYVVPIEKKILNTITELPKSLFQKKSSDTL